MEASSPFVFPYLESGRSSNLHYSRLPYVLTGVFQYHFDLKPEHCSMSRCGARSCLDLVLNVVNQTLLLGNALRLLYLVSDRIPVCFDDGNLPPVACKALSLVLWVDGWE